MKFERCAIPDDIRDIAEILEGYDVYPVGGVVRDSVKAALERGQDSVHQAVAGEWDLTTSAPPEAVEKLLKKAGYKTFDIGAEHGTITAIKNDETYEITTFRTDVNTDGRHAEVEYGCTLEEDVQRRDFTVNSMVIDLKTLEVIDLCGGMDDLRIPLIRTVGDPFDRFEEDHLRLLRAIRFATHLSAEIHEDTWQAMIEKAPKIRQISAERVRDELMRIMAAQKPSTGLMLMHDCGLLKEIIPEFDSCFDVAQNKHHSHDVGRHTLLSVDAVSPRFPFLRIITLLHDLGKPGAKMYLEERDDYVFYGHENTSAEMAEDILRRLRFTNKEIEQASILISEHMFRLTDPDIGKKGLRRFLQRVERENLAPYLRMRIADRAGNLAWEEPREPGLWTAMRRLREIERDQDALHVTDLAIGGADLIEMGMRPGPEFSNILNGLLERVLDDPSLNEREKLLDIVRNELISS